MTSEPTSKKGIDITLSEVSNQSTSFIFPSLPQNIRVKTGARYQTHEILSKGTIKIPNGIDVSTISWEGFFYGEAKRFEAMMRKKLAAKSGDEDILRNWISPSDCMKTLTRWMENGTVLRLLVDTTRINHDVTISNFDYEEYGPHGSIKYSITFTVYKELKIYTLSEVKDSAYLKKTTSRTSVRPAKTYTITAGDTLWAIAKKCYGSGSSWMRIYDNNSDIIESAAKKSGRTSSDIGHWIYPGTVLSV